MVLVFIFCTIIIISTLFICMILLSTLRLKIENFAMTNMNDMKEKHSKQYQLVISLYLLNKVKWFSIRLNDKKMRSMYHKMQLEKFDLKQIEEKFKIEDLKEIKRLNPKISYFNLDIDVGVEDVVLTSFIIFAVSTIISAILPYVIKKYEKDKYNYKIVPVYINKNVYKIKFDCIIEVKMVHIINIIYVFIKKRRGDSHDKRTSNRRSYGYSYE